MPKIDGLELLREIKNDPKLRYLPVVVMAGTFNEAKIQQCYDLGTNAVVVKPANYAQFAEFVRTLCQFWLTMNEPLKITARVRSN